MPAAAQYARVQGSVQADHGNAAGKRHCHLGFHPDRGENGEVLPAGLISQRRFSNSQRLGPKSRSAPCEFGN